MLAVHIWRVRKDGFAVQRTSVGAFAEEATERPLAAPAAASMAQVAPELYGGRVRLLGVVDRESITEAARPVDDTVFTWPHLLVRHVVVALGTAAVVLGLAVAFSAPLHGLANPNVTPASEKAPWYFAGLQELLSHFDPLLAGILIPAGAVLIFVLLPYIDRNPDTRASHRKVAIMLFTVLLAIAVGLTVIGVFFRGPGWEFIAPWTHSYIEF
jgi:quinol-cytochrome oxidoreductase complex cytochrome b subunit